MSKFDKSLQKFVKPKVKRSLMFWTKDRACHKEFTFEIWIKASSNQSKIKGKVNFFADKQTEDGWTGQKLYTPISLPMGA